MVTLTPGSCNLSCLRQRMEKQVKTYIKALKKSINQERFPIRVAGLEYEVAQKLPQAATSLENCGPGRERDNGRCGKRGERGGDLVREMGGRGGRKDEQGKLEMFNFIVRWLEFRL